MRAAKDVHPPDSKEYCDTFRFALLLVGFGLACGAFWMWIHGTGGELAEPEPQDAVRELTTPSPSETHGALLFGN